MEIYLISLFIALASIFDLCANNAVVKVEKTSEQGVKSYTCGFLINKSGHILSFHNGYEQYTSLSIRVPYLEEPLSATIQAIYPELCTAVLKLTYASLQRIQAALGDIPYLELNRNPNLTQLLNHNITALGYGLIGDHLQSQTGIISGSYYFNNRLYLLGTHHSSPGYGGWPVIDSFNKVIGIIIASENGRAISYILPIINALAAINAVNKAAWESAKNLPETLKNGAPSFWQMLPKDMQQEALKFFLETQIIQIPQPTA